MSAQPGPYGQGQQYLPNPGSFVQNPAGTVIVNFFLCPLHCSLFITTKSYSVVVWWVCVH